MCKIETIYNLFAVIIVVSTFNYVLSTPMLYKRNQDDTYERDLVPVSSTVIPLTALEVSYGLGGKPSDEYKEAYLKKLRKKVHHEKIEQKLYENPDTLITGKMKRNNTNEKTKDIATMADSALIRSKK